MTLETHHHNIDITELDEQSYLHPFTSVTESRRSRPWMIEGGSGIHITDSKGQTYIDATSGLICVNVGYGREEVARAIYDQARKLSYFHTFWGTGNEPAARLADRIVDITPGNMRRVMFGTSGSDANDTQIKLCWYYNNVLGRPQKKKIIARERGYHGTTLAAASVTGNARPAQAVRPASPSGHLDLGARLRQEGRARHVGAGLLPGAGPRARRSD